MKDLTLVKVGGSIITDKSRPFTANNEMIGRIAKEIHEAREEKEIKLIIGHGGGSFPHKPAKDYRVNEGIINKESIKGISLVQNAAEKLNRIFVDALIEKGENAVSVQPSASLIAEDGRIKEWYTEPIKEMLKYDLLPVPYGDVALDTKKGCCIISTEKILNYLARKFNAKRIIVVGKVDGVFTADPNTNKNVRMITEINSKNYEKVRRYLAGSEGIDVTGGMLHKIDEMFELAKLGFESEIINATKRDYLKRALLGERGLGTRITF